MAKKNKPTKKKDLRYEVVRTMLQKKKIKTFQDIFKYIPHSVVASDMRTNNNRMRELINRPWKLKLEEVFRLADLFKYDKRKMVNLIADSHKP